MRKGSITIFALISMVLVAACLFTLLEAARYIEIKNLTSLQTKLCTESVFANYSTPLWEEYHLLACDKWSVEEILIANANARYDADEKRVNMLQFQVSETELAGYTLLTDDGGAAYINAISSYMEKNLLYETAKNIYSQYEAVKELQEESDFDISDVGRAIEEIHEIKNESETNAISVGTSGTQNKEQVNTDDEAETLLQTMKTILDMGILELVIEDTSQLSTAERDFSNAVSKRSLLQGENSVVADSDWISKVYLQQYLLTYLSNFTNQNEGGALAYEIEYLIGKKSSDIENLKSVATQLLGIREAANYLYLINNSKSVAEAEALAMGIAGVSGNPLVVKLVKNALLVVWAFAESILDVRAILAGKKVAFFKDEALWNLDLKDITTISTGYAMAKECEQGLGYKNYLGILLLFQKGETLAMHAMNIQELTIQQKYDMPEFRMDDLMVQARVNMSYSYTPIFPMVSKSFSPWKYEIKTSTEFKY